MKKTKSIHLITLTLIVIVATWALSPAALSRMYESLSDRALFGESFGAVSSLFSALSVVGIIAALWIQRQDSRRALATQTRMLHIELLKMSLSDPDLDEVWRNGEESSNKEGKQTIFINLILCHWEMLYLQGSLSETQLRQMGFQHFRYVAFEQYWKKYGKDRLSFAVKNSDEERFLKALDKCFEAVTQNGRN